MTKNIKTKKCYNATKKAPKDESGLETCDSLLDVIKHMTNRADECAKDNMSATAIVLEEYAKRLVLIHNRQAVFNDALKRALKLLQKRLDTSDALTSVLASYVEATQMKPFTFDETRFFEKFVDEIDQNK